MTGEDGTGQGVTRRQTNYEEAGAQGQLRFIPQYISYNNFALSELGLLIYFSGQTQVVHNEQYGNKPPDDGLNIKIKFQNMDLLEPLIPQLIVILVIIFLIRYVFRKWRTKKTDAAYEDRINKADFSVLGNAPGSINGLLLKKVEGVVTHVKVATEVSGIRIINSNIIKEIFVQLEDGSEFSHRFDQDILIREGHKLTLIKVFFTEAKFRWVYFFNHSTREEIYFNQYEVIRDVTKKSFIPKGVFWHPGNSTHYLRPEYNQEVALLISKIQGEMQRTSFAG